METILHPTPFVNVDGSNTVVASCAEILSIPLDRVPPNTILSEIVVAAPCSAGHPTSHAGCPSAEQIVAHVRSTQ